MTHVADVTIDNTEVAADLTDYPVYVDLSDLPASFWSTVASGGGDIRCYKSDGTTELAREVVSCDTTAETGELHLLYSGTLSSSVDTVIQIHADGSSADYAAGATYGRNEVWSDYGAVYHMADNPSGGTLTDATGNGYDMAFLTSMSAGDSVSGIVGSAIQFDGSTEGAFVNSAPSGDDPYTISAIIKPDVIAGAPAAAVDKDSDTDYLRLLASTAIEYRADKRFSSTLTAAGGSPVVGEWAHLHGVYDDPAVELFISGVSVDTDTGSNMSHQFDSLSIGFINRDSGGAHFGGAIDEVRFSTVARSDNWIATEYANQSDPSTFYAATDPSAGGGTNYDVSVTFGSEGGVTMTGLVGAGADFTVDMSAGIDSSALADASADFTASAQAGAVIESRADFLVSITTGAEAGQAMTGAVTAGGTVLASLLVSAEMGATATAEAQALASMLTSAQAGQVMAGSVDGVTNIEAAMLAGYDAGASAEAQADALAALLVSYGAGLSAFEDSSIPASMVLSAGADIGMTATIGAEVSFITAAETDSVLSGQVDASAVIEVSAEAAATMIASAASSAGIEVASIANIEIFASSFSGDIVTPEHRIYRVSFELRTFSVEPRVSTFTVQ
jgi:hypothetical protein